MTNVVPFPKLVNRSLVDRDGPSGGREVNRELSTTHAAIQRLCEQFHASPEARGLNIVAQMNVDHVGIYGNGSFLGVWQFTNGEFDWIPASYLSPQLRCTCSEASVEFTLGLVEERLLRSS